MVTYLHSFFELHPETDRIIVFNDTHFRSEDERIYELFLGELKKLELKQFDYLIFLGDIFDLLPGRIEFVQKFPKFWRQIQDLKQQKVQIFYIEGNHDFNLDLISELNQKMTIVQDGGINLVSQEIRIHFNHGDLVNPEDKGYILLRKFLRSHFFRWFTNIVPKKLLILLGNYASRWSRNYTQVNLQREQFIRNLYRQWSINLFRNGFDLVICGHNHLADQYQQGNKTYFNCGLFSKEMTYLLFTHRTRRSELVKIGDSLN